jgi:uncharacterized protein YndB with AHSA1/START domain
MNDNTFRTEIFIAAKPERVFDYFLKPELMVKWMGEFAVLDASDGGLFRVDIQGVLIRGHYVRIERPTRSRRAWGEAGNEAMPPGSTRLVLRMVPKDDGTELTLEHSGLTAPEAAKHEIGWRHYLPRLVDVAEGRDPGVDSWDEPPAS